MQTTFKYKLQRFTMKLCNMHTVARKRLRSLYSSMWSATVLLIIAVGPTYFWPKLLCRTIPCYRPISYDMGTVVPTARYRADVSHVDRRFVLIVLKNNKNSVELLGTDVDFLLESVATNARFTSVDAQPLLLIYRASHDDLSDFRCTDDFL